MYSQSTRSLVARSVILCTVAVLIANEVGAAYVARPSAHVRIVNGTPIPIEDAAYAVQITDSFGFWICGGSLVSQQFVVSAAHCFPSRFPRELRVIAGAVAREDYGANATKVGVSKIMVHPQYVFAYDPRKENEHMDVAVLKLAEPIAFSRQIQSIQMCTTPVEADQLIQIVGWGQTKSKGPQSKVLQSIDVPVFSRSDCIEMHEDSASQITDSMVCAGALGDKDACQGDSGGPAVRQGELCGIVSWGVGCADKTHPGIYTSIPVVRDFIDKSMRE